MTRNMEILRATRTAQQAAAYYVRIQAMARKHRIPLDAEFDEHDTPQTKYIVVMDDFLPVATCRLYGLDAGHVMLGRIVVLPEYRHQGLGRHLMRQLLDSDYINCCYLIRVVTSKIVRLKFS